VQITSPRARDDKLSRTTFAAGGSDGRIAETKCNCPRSRSRPTRAWERWTDDVDGRHLADPRRARSTVILALLHAAAAATAVADPPVSSRITTTTARIVSMVTSQGSGGFGSRIRASTAGSLAAGEGAGDLVHGVRRGALDPVGATFGLQASVSGQHAGGFVHAPLRLIDVLAGHEAS
jgi:hypothetical protein